MAALFETGKTYSREQVESTLGCEGRGYLPMRAGKVVCGFFTLYYNPDAPHILLPGKDGGRERCAAIFCEQKFGVPVFLKEPSAYLWKYVGEYQVDRWSEKTSDIAEQNRRSRRNDVTRVIYLSPASSQIRRSEFPEHTPSSYQQAIYDFQEQGRDDLFVEAVAGSGKTSALLGLARRLPQELHGDALFVAFTKSIANKLEETLPPTLKAATLHRIGNSILRRAAGGAVRLDHSKYDHSDEVTTNLIHLAMVTLTEPEDAAALEELARQNGLAAENISATTRRVLDAITRGKAEWQERISYDDMIYLPNVLDLPMPKFKRLYCDEAQDLSRAQLGLLLRLRAPGGRIIFVGDKNQAIFGFAGADTHSVQNILKTTRAHQLPLSVCYRCPKSHIAKAQKIVPRILPHEDAPEGIVAHISEDDLFITPDVRARAGDMILCRIAAPLVDMALRLRAARVPAKVRGLDIGQAWIAIVDRALEQGWSEFPNTLDEFAERNLTALRAIGATDLSLVTELDRVNAIQRIYRQVRDEDPDASPNDLRTAIKSLFTDDAEDPDTVLLSTVHRAKGLEGPRVYLLRPELMPHPSAMTDDEKQQEQNLYYVALTRSKDSLFFVLTQDPNLKKDTAVP